MTRTTVIFAGGGTGGHLFPGIAVARELMTSKPSIRSVFVGSNREIEKEILSQTKFEHFSLSVAPVSQIKKNPVRFTWRNWNAYCEAKQLLKKTDANVVVGLGGFASLPMLYAARKSNLPVLLMEQNIVLGRANKWFSKRAQRIALTFAETEGLTSMNSDHVRVTGNPVRKDIALLNNSSTDKGITSPRTLLVLGGSQGATAVNQAVMDAITEVKELKDQHWKIVHQTGVHQALEIQQFYSQQNLECHVTPFFSEMSPLYLVASLVISRAGATTLAELASAGCPAILIPYPNSVGDHQLKNANYFQQANASRTIEQQKTPQQTAQHLSEVLTELLHDSTLLADMQTAMSHLAAPDAAKRVADIVRDLITK